MRARIFLSWCHLDQSWKEKLLLDLRPALSSFTDLNVEWWEDSHLTCGEDLVPGIIDRLDEADYGLLLLSNRYFNRPFIRRHELPRFVGPVADKGSLPVALTPLPSFGPHRDLGGIERQVVFTRNRRSFRDQHDGGRERFAIELADMIRRRILGLNGYTAP